MTEAQKLKNEGNQAFMNKDYEKAIELYTQAIEKDSNDVSFFSNRSGAYFNLGKFDQALSDAEIILSKDPKFSKGYQRKGLALEKLQKYEEAAEAFNEGLKIDPTNKELQQGKDRCESNLGGGFDIN